MIQKFHKYTPDHEVHTISFVQKYWFWVFIFMFVALQVYFTIRTSAMGVQLQSLETKANEISEKNRKLREELVNSSSLTKLEEKGSQIGFVKPQKILYLGGDEFVAKAQ